MQKEKNKAPPILKLLYGTRDKINIDHISHNDVLIKKN